METMADLWIIWLIGFFCAILYCILMYLKIFLSILRDDNQTFDLGIYRRLWDYGIGFILIFVFLILLIISGIGNIVITVTD